MITFTHFLAGAALCVGLGATVALAAHTSALDKFPDAKDAIMSYYAANAREGGGNSGAGHIASIGDARVVSERGDQAVVAVDYTFSATATGGTTAACSGPAMREFTLSKGGSGWSVTGMTGHKPQAAPPCAEGPPQRADAPNDVPLHASTAVGDDLSMFRGSSHGHLIERSTLIKPSELTSVFDHPRSGSPPTCRVVKSGEPFVGKQGHLYRPGISAETVGSRALHLQLVELRPGERGKAHKHRSHETASMSSAVNWGPFTARTRGASCRARRRVSLHPRGYAASALQPEQHHALRRRDRAHRPERAGKRRSAARVWSGRRA